MTSDSNAKKGPPRRRRRSAQGGRGGGMPPIMWLAVLACIVGAVVLFRSGGGDAPVGIGENQTLVTAPETTPDSSAVHTAPRSGDVDIGDATRNLTPEQPAAGAADAGKTAAAAQTTPQTTPRTTAAKTEEKPAETAPSPTTTKPAATRSSTPPPPPVSPRESGPYVVQVGSFGSFENAQKEVDRLAARGWRASIKVSDTSEGTVVNRVRIGYFATRAEAETFIRQNRRHLSGAIPVHR